MASAVVAAPGIAGPAAAMVSVVNHLGIIAGRNHAGLVTCAGRDGKRGGAKQFGSVPVEY